MENKLENNSAEGKERERVRDGEGKEEKKTKVKSKTVKNVGLDDGNWH